ncbi:hypothetical protein N657DRAFT_684384 [Parathielavia appendiculata]|uniref:Rhodopsin domain-containing protein n=1 Tax=Parathielavia appendiculata TaxID=2587402 RepID=A0AAN6TSZ3_9PEZI|nr:hypothetical protein N657DRAFT_684384 [Parathielavia appendiculata]
MILKPGVVRALPSDEGDATIFPQTNIAIWVLTAASGAFLALRLGCRQRFSKLWWDDGLLSLSWLILLVAAALLSRTISAGYATEDAKRTFFLYQNTSNCMTTLATAWSKVAFAITLSRIVRNQYLRYFLWFVMVTANLILVIAMVAIWIPACTDPRRVLRPEHTRCLDLKVLQYLGGTTIVYGGVIDVLLALFPWFIIRKLLLDTREKLGLTLAMSLGAITGTVVIFRAFFTLRDIDNNYHNVVFMSIFNFLEPGITIIAQAIPMFRVLLVNVRKNSNAVRISSPSGVHPSGSVQHRTWNSKARDRHREPDEELFQVRVGPGGRIIQLAGPDDSGSDKLDDTK